MLVLAKLHEVSKIKGSYDFVDVNKIVLIVLKKLIVRKSTHQI